MHYVFGYRLYALCFARKLGYQCGFSSEGRLQLTILRGSIQEPHFAASINGSLLPALILQEASTWFRYQCWKEIKMKSISLLVLLLCSMHYGESFLDNALRNGK